MVIAYSDGTAYESQSHEVAGVPMGGPSGTKKDFEQYPDDITYEVMAEKFGQENSDFIKSMDDHFRKETIKETEGKSIEFPKGWAKNRINLMQQWQYQKEQPQRDPVQGAIL